MENEKAVSIHFYSSLESLHAFYFKCSYYTGGLPFRMRFSKDQSTYEILKPTVIPRVLIATVQALSASQILWFIIYMPNIINDTTDRSMMNLNILIYTLWLMYFLVSVWTGWTKQDDFVDILRRTNHLERLLNNLNLKILLKWQVVVIGAAIIFVLALTTFVEIFLVDYSIFNGTTTDIYGRYITLGNNVYLFQDNPKGFLSSIPLKLLALVRLFFVVHSNFLTLFFNGLCLSFVIPLFLATRTLIKHLEASESAKHDFSYVMTIVDELLELSDSMASGMSLLISSECFMRLPYHCLKLKNVLEDPSMLKRFMAVCLYAVWMVFLFISAETNSLIKRLVPYLRKSQKFRMKRDLPEKLDTFERISLLLTEITQNNFGVRGIGFTITYGLVGSLTGLIVTYAIILYQFEDSLGNDLRV